MRNMICLACALALCLSLACPVFADTFVPSITYKDGPAVRSAELEAAGTGGTLKVDDCLAVTSILAAREATSDIPQEQRELLLELYEKLENGTEELPLEGGTYVIRELVDICFAQAGCVQAGHDHAGLVNGAEGSLALTLDLGVTKSDKVRALVYGDGSWTEATDLTNNGDGTVTGLFKTVGPVAVCLETVEDAAESSDNSQTGGSAMGGLWTCLGLGALLGLAALAAGYRKRAR